MARGKAGVEKAARGGGNSSLFRTCIRKEIHSYRREEDIAGGAERREVGEEVPNTCWNLCCARRDAEAGWGAGLGPFLERKELVMDGPR